MITKTLKRSKNTTKEIIPYFFLTFLLLFLIGFLIISNFKIFQKQKEQKEKIDNLKKEIQVLEEKNRSLISGIYQTQKESYWEEKIRQEGYVKEGEKPVVVLSPKETQKENLIEGQNLNEKFFNKIKKFFAGLVEWFNTTFPR